MSADMDIWGVPARKVVEQGERQADIGQDPVASVMTPSEPIEAPIPNAYVRTSCW